MLPTLLLNIGLEAVLPPPTPCAHKPEMMVFFCVKSYTNNLFFPEGKLMSTIMQMVVSSLFFFAKAKASESLSVFMLGSVDQKGKNKSSNLRCRIVKDKVLVNDLTLPILK